ncbi:alpha/beta hydrolase family protein [Altericista sp. CCNU0014]|uniref:alpha/beta hydrolase family protein n=1 Tax=Altericista sp. CCNU0014 TaxID=3082949 RepID=UPI00384CF5AC
MLAELREIQKMTGIRVGLLQRYDKCCCAQRVVWVRLPLFSADKIQRPLPIGHGANDPRVKQAESDRIVEAMRKNNKPVEYILCPDEGHGFVRPANRLHFFASAEAFLAKHLGGRVEPMGNIAGHSGQTK